MMAPFSARPAASPTLCGRGSESAARIRSFRVPKCGATRYLRTRLAESSPAGNEPRPQSPWRAGRAGRAWGAGAGGAGVGAGGGGADRGRRGGGDRGRRGGGVRGGRRPGPAASPTLCGRGSQSPARIRSFRVPKCGATRYLRTRLTVSSPAGNEPRPQSPWRAGGAGRAWGAGGCCAKRHRGTKRGASRAISADCVPPFEHEQNGAAWTTPQIRYHPTASASWKA
jgi:hypothetical protein